MKHKNSYSHVLVSFLTKHFRAPSLSASIAVFLLLAFVFQPLAVVFAYEESGQVQAVDASMSTSTNLDSGSVSGMTTIDPVRGSTSNIDVVEASPSIVLDNISGTREEVFGDSLTEADVVLDPVTDTAEPEATGTDDTDIAGDGEEAVVEEGDGVAGMPIEDPVVATQPESYYEQNTQLTEVDNKTGALIYGYDFALPPFRDMNPSLSLGYNSQSEVLSTYTGYGWELSIPYIKRINRTGVDKIYTDNYYYSSMHGELTPISIDALGYGTYGSRVEQGAYALYTRNIDGSWALELSDGTSVAFGATSASRQDNPADATKVFRWMVSSMSDTHANTVNYTYTKSGGQIYPATIEYGEADVVLLYTTYTDSIKDYSTGFLVENNQNLTGVDVSWGGVLEKEYDLAYMQQEYSARYLLENVTDKSGDEDLATEFGYTDTVQQNGWVYDDTWFDTDDSILYNDVMNELEKEKPATKVFDINGDGYLDFICAGVSHDCGYQGQTVYLNNGKEFVDEVSMYPNWPTIPSSVVDIGNDGLGFYNNSNGDYPTNSSRYIQALDINGDSLVDFIDFGKYRGEYFTGTTTYYEGVFINNGNGWDYSSDYFDTTSTYFTEVVSAMKYTTGSSTYFFDVNTDGLVDIVCAELSGSNCSSDGYFSFISNGDNYTQTDISNWPEIPESFYDIGGHGLAFYNNDNSDYAEDSPRYLFTLDMNGDGLVDFLDAGKYKSTYITGSPTIKYEGVYINNGNGWDYTDTYLDYNDEQLDDVVYGLRNKAAYTMNLDINNDGFVDMICAVKSGDFCNYTGSLIYLNDGTKYVQYEEASSAGWPVIPDGFEDIGGDEIEFYNDDDNDYPENASRNILMIDINGDSMLDFFDAGQYHSDYDEVLDRSYLGTFINQNTKPNLLTTITSNSGLVTEITHKATGAFKGEDGEIINKINVYNNWVVEHIETTDSITTSTKSYFYEGADAYIDAPYYKKFAGFSVVTETDSDGNVTKNYYHQGNDTNTGLGENEDNFAKIGRVYRTEKYDSAGNLYETTINKWDSVNLGTDRDFVKLARSASLTYDSDADHKDRVVEYTYDDTTGNKLTEKNWGEVTASGVDGSFTDIGTDTRNTTYTYAEDVTGVMQFPSQVTITDNVGTKLREEKYFYDNQPFGVATKGDMTKKNTWKTGATYVSETYTYNTYGNVTKYKDPLSNQTTYTYDAYNLYPTTVKNPLNHSTLYTYDYTSGKPLTIKNPNGFTSTYVYDGLDRVIEEKTPNPTTGVGVTKTTYVYDDMSFPRSVHKSVYCDVGIAKEVYTYVDGFGRVIQTRSELETPDMYTVTDTIYDARGNISVTSLPYEATGLEYEDATDDEGLLTTFAYDPMNRVVSIENILGTTTYEYDDWKKTVVDANEHAKVFYENAYGNLVQVTEKNGFFSYNTYYTWNTIGELTKITDALGNVRNFTYNGFGKRLTAEDLHAPADVTFGVWTYTYDNAGNMTKTVSPKAETVNYTYDVLNRVLSENWTGGPGVEVTYTYDTCTNGKGKLCSAVRGSVTTTYTYTPTEQVKDESTTIDGTVYTTTTSYNYCGSPIEITHPNGTKTRYLYDAIGAVNGIQRKETTGGYQNIVATVDYTEFGKPETVSFANGVVTTYSYGDLQRLSDIDTIKDANVIQDLHYDYDPVGNIIAITDASGTATTKTAMYTYDTLDRLTLAEVYGTPEGEDYVETFSYNAIGNLTMKGDSGTYLYQGSTGTNYANPHAATKVGVVTFTYDNNGNLTNDGTNTYSWNYRNEQTSATTPTGATSYVYNHDGARMKYVAPGQTVITPASTYEVEGAVQRRHVYLGDMLVGTVETGVATPGTRYAHTDHLGSVEKMTDSTGAILETNDYFPYGEIRVKEGDTGGDRSYLGKYHDDATGLEYLEARYYSSARGQFVSQDPAFWDFQMVDRQLADPQLWNSYSYSRNNPLLYKDEKGESPSTFAEGLANGVTIAAVVTLAIVSAPITIPASAVAAAAIAGTAAMGYGTYENYKAYENGEISKDEFDYNAGAMIGGALIPGGAAESKALQQVTKNSGAYDDVFKAISNTSANSVNGKNNVDVFEGTFKDAENVFNSLKSEGWSTTSSPTDKGTVMTAVSPDGTTSYSLRNFASSEARLPFKKIYGTIDINKSAGSGTGFRKIGEIKFGTKK